MQQSPNLLHGPAQPGFAPGHQAPDSALAELWCKARSLPSRSLAPPCQMGPTMAFISARVVAARPLPPEGRCPWAQTHQTPWPLSTAPWLGAQSPSKPEPPHDSLRSICCHHPLQLSPPHPPKCGLTSLPGGFALPCPLARPGLPPGPWSTAPGHPARGPENAFWVSLTLISFSLILGPAPSLGGHGLVPWDLAHGTCVTPGCHLELEGRGSWAVFSLVAPHPTHRRPC